MGNEARKEKEQPVGLPAYSFSVDFINKVVGYFGDCPIKDQRAGALLQGIIAIVNQQDQEAKATEGKKGPVEVVK